MIYQYSNLERQKEVAAVLDARVRARRAAAESPSGTERARQARPLELARGTAMMDRRKIKGGTPALRAELGYPPRLSVDKVSARVPT